MALLLLEMVEGEELHMARKENGMENSRTINGKERGGNGKRQPTRPEPATSRSLTAEL